MVWQGLAQAAIVLTMPEWLTIGLFMWVKGIKPFHLAFPKINALIGSFSHSFSHLQRLDYGLPILAAVVVHSIFSKRS